MCKNQPEIVWIPSSHLWCSSGQHPRTNTIYSLYQRSSSLPISCLFTDDTKCLHIIKDLSDYSALQNDAENLTNYSDSWHLKFNITTCIHLHYHFSSSTHTPTYYIKGKEIPRQSETKNLGIIFNRELSWDQHYNSLTSRAYRTLYLLQEPFLLQQ